MYPFKFETVSIDSVQFAADGKWEEVQTVHPGNPDDLATLSSWLDRVSEDVAAEVLFVDDQGELDGFFGVRTIAPTGPDRSCSWVNFTKQATETSELQFSELVARCLPTLGFPTTIPNSELTYEIGVFNYWNSATPLLLGTTPLDSINDYRQDDQSPSWLNQGHLAPICLEYVWHDPAHIWVSRAISRKRDDRYFVDMALVEKTLFET